MSLSPGIRLGSYEISAPLGAGGMGEVYRARDTRLARDVALKLLPPALAGDPDRLMRFEREARTLAALNHPNIAQIYGVEESEGHRALVMELVEGPTLEDAIFGPSRPDVGEVLGWFRQIADALEVAHEAGVIHRDLKPANVKVRPDGTVKVLDFGLAKAQMPGSSGSGAAEVGPTMTSPAMTAMGVILGTAAYMAPEQARGRAVDRRADIWSFGVMLHEALTGTRGFGGETISDTIAAVLTRSLEMNALPARTPASVRSLIARCLEKDPRRRLRDIGEARLILETPGAVDSPAAAPPAPASRSSAARVALAAIASAGAAALATWAALGVGPPAAPPAIASRSHVAQTSSETPIRGGTISPDGRTLAYAAAGKLWVRRLDQWDSRELLTLTTPVITAWSPRGDAIAYVEQGDRLMTLALDGGVPRFIVRLPPRKAAPVASVGVVWPEDGRILVTTGEGPLYAVSATGGDLTPVAQPPPAPPGSQRGFTDFHVPVPIPGRGALVALLHRDAGLDAIVVIDPADGSSKIVLDTPGVGMNRVVASPTGHLVYARESDGTLWAVPFDHERLETTGAPFSLGAGRSPSVSPDGTLFYVMESGVAADQRMAWVSRTGGAVQTAVPQREWGGGIALSRDERQAVAAGPDGLWVFDLTTGTRRRLTRNAADRDPVWLPDGRIAFARVEGEAESIYLVNANGGEETLVTDNGRWPTADARGTRLVFNSTRSGRRMASWIDLAEPSEVHDVPGLVGARFASISPDGTLMAYVSNETGQDEVWLTRFPSGEGRWQVSANRGGFAKWSPKGDELFFRGAGVDSAPAMMAVRVTGGAEPAISAPTELFSWGQGWHPAYAIAADGQRFLALVAPNTGASSSVRMVRDWWTEHDKR